MEDEKQKLAKWLSYLKSLNSWNKPRIGFAYLCDKYIYDSEGLLLYKEIICSSIAEEIVGLLLSGNQNIEQLYENNKKVFADHKRLSFFFESLCKLYGLTMLFEYNDDSRQECYHLDLKKQEQERSADYYYNLACAQKTNKGIEDWNLYTKYMEKASEMSHLQAMQCMARLYLKGKHVSKDERKAVQLLKKCAELRDGRSCYELYRYYHEHSTEKTNEKYYLDLAAKLNVSEAQYDLAMLYYNNATDADYQKAFSLFTNAANNGEPCAYYQLALCYRFGHGVPKDMTKAMNMLSEAAKLGHAEAKRIIG